MTVNVFRRLHIGVGVGRIMIGAAVLAKPNLLARSLNSKPLPPNHGELSLTSRMFAIRELALGVATLGPGRARDAALGAGVVSDVADALLTIRTLGAPARDAATAGVFAGISALALTLARSDSDHTRLPGENGHFCG